jgi:DNA-directed RNA polymerase subunit F
MKSKYITTSEVYDILSKKKEYTEIEGENLSYVERVMKIKGTDAKKIKADLMKQLKLSDKVATKIVDLAPQNKEEATSILSSYGVLLNEEDLNTVISYFALD